MQVLIDFDGVFVPNFIKSLNVKNDNEVENAEKLKIYREIDMKAINLISILSVLKAKITIITGRKAYLLESFTKELLKHAGIYDLIDAIIFYPKENSYSHEAYYEWKKKVLESSLIEYPNEKHVFIDDDLDLIKYLKQNLSQCALAESVYPVKYFQCEIFDDITKMIFNQI